MSSSAIPWPPPSARPVETHISTVWLTEAYAYKVKKPVHLVFLDARDLATRERFCREELRLNARTAPGLYLDVLPVTQDRAGVWLDGPGDTVDWVVRMHRFPDDALLAHHADAGTLTPDQIDGAAAAIARFHRAERPLPATAARPKTLRHWAAENVEEILELAGRQSTVDVGPMRSLGQRLDQRFAVEASWSAARTASGWLRECHGDLHLGNLIAWRGAVTAFDAIDFDASLRIIDPIADVAFTWMDLLARGYRGLAWRLLGGYLEELGSYDALVGLRTFAAYRALVRAKVALLLDDQSDFVRYWRVAEQLCGPVPAPALILMTGLSGSGKSTAAAMLAESLGAVRTRSDVERKRLFDLAPTARPTDRETLYGASASARTYERLASVARDALTAGFRVVVDAAALRQDERARFKSLAHALGVGFALVECVADPAQVSARMMARSAADTDASDADLAVRQQQGLTVEPVPASWSADHHVLRNDDDLQALRAAAERLAGRLEDTWSA